LLKTCNQTSFKALEEVT